MTEKTVFYLFIWSPKKRMFSIWQIWALAAGLLCAIFWGYQQNSQITELERVIHRQQKDIERMQRVSAQPATPRMQPYVMPTKSKQSKHVPVVFDM